MQIMHSAANENIGLIQNFEVGKALICKNVDHLANKLLRGIVATLCGPSIEVRQVITVQEYEFVKESRLRMYEKRGSYFDKLIEADGSDKHDSHSYIFAAYHEGKIIGSIRLTSYPFEICDHVERMRLHAFLGPNYQDTFLELSRLVVDRQIPAKGVARALIIYSGGLTSLLTNYKRYVAIARPEVRRRSFHFKISADALPFFIEERGSHQYEAISGSFISDFYDIMGANLNVVNDVINDGRKCCAEQY